MPIESRGAVREATSIAATTEPAPGWNPRSVGNTGSRLVAMNGAPARMQSAAAATRMYVSCWSRPTITASGWPAAAQPSIPSWLIRVAAWAAGTTSKPASRSSRSSPPAPTASTRRTSGKWSLTWIAVARADVTTLSGPTGAPWLVSRLA